MKSVLQIAVGILFLLTLFTSCSKDKDSKSNEIKIADTTINLAGGALINFGEFPAFYDGYEFDLVLHGADFAITEMDGEIDLEGSDFMLYCEMFSDSADFLAAGVYTFDDLQVNPTKTFGNCYYKFQYSIVGNFYINSGTIEVKQGKNGIYEFIVHVTDEDDNAITAYYKGPMLSFVGHHYF